MLALVVGGCSSPFDALIHPGQFEIRWWPHDRPALVGGELMQGGGTVLEVEPVPAGSQVHLYVSRGGEGPGPCTLVGGVCSGMLDPTLVRSLTVGTQGMARFQIPAGTFDELGPIAWQALVQDPELPGVQVLTEVAVRHVAVGPDDARVRFEEVTRASGTDVQTVGNTHTGGVAFVDLNNDLWPDLYISNGAARQNALFRNDGDGTFTRLRDAVPKPPQGSECAGVKAADIDNDGDVDLIVPVDNPQQMVSFEPQPAEGGPNLLYLNEGNLTFADDPVAMAAAAGLDDPRQVRNSSASLADYDLDGCIDVYFTHWAMAASPGGVNHDRLLHNNCDGTFTDVTAEMGTDGHGRDGLVGFWWDHDFDRYPELYVGNNSDEDRGLVLDPLDVFYRNRGGTAFDEWTEGTLADGTPVIGYDAWAAMGVDVGDIDADGDWDLYITDVNFLDPVPHGNVLYIGEDGGLSENRCHDFGVCFGYNSWPANFEDFDNDGYIDLWVGSSLPRTPDMVFLNEGGTGMVSHRQTGFTGHTARSGTTADFDGDGDMDIFLWHDSGAANATSSLFENQLIEGRSPDLTGMHWIELKLVGTESNRSAIGAVVRAEVGGVPVMRRVTGGDSAHAHRMFILHIGLGIHEQLDRIEITWPRPEAVSPVQVVEDLAADRVWIVDETAGKVDHAFIDPTATLSGGRLEITTASNYGGRADIDVEGYGALDYDAATVSYEARFTAKGTPTEVRLLTSYGDPQIVPVTSID